jgi:membrane fusion protein, multidrug efflux system
MHRRSRRGARPGAPPGAPRRRRRVLVVVVGTGILASGTVGYLAWAPDGSDEATAAPVSSGTATVRRKDLVVTEELSGTLAFADQRKVTAARAGTVTSTAAEGSTVRFGKTLFAIDLEPTVLLRGKVPAYRALSTESADGPDVEQLERALVDLGYAADLSVDREYTSATASAVQEWEDDLGRDDPDGKVSQGDLVFAETALRVGSVEAAAGAPAQAGTAVLAAASTSRVVDLDLDASRSNDLEVGAEVTLTMPDGKDTTGTVASVGSQTETSSTDPQADPSVPVEIAVDRPATAKAFDSGTVDVVLERSRDENVLVLPVTALLALREGGYAVQIVDPSQGNGYRLGAVTIGTVADDEVAVTGDGIKPGVEVRVPS